VATIHPSAIVHPNAVLGEGVVIGPFCIVEEDVTIGEGTELLANVIVHRWTSLGRNNRVRPGVVLGGAAQDFKYQGEETWLRIGDNNMIGESVTMHRGSREGSATTVGDNNFFMGYTHVAHDCHVANHVVMTNYSGLAGHCTVDDGAIIAAYAGTHQGVRVGTLAMLGAGALTSQDITPFTTAVGVPARPVGLNSIGMQRAGIPDEHRQLVQQAWQILFTRQLTVENAVAAIKDEVAESPAVQMFLTFIEGTKRGIAMARRKNGE